MNRRSLHRSDLLWLGVIVAAVAMHWLLPDFRADVSTDSFRAGPRGKKALYLLTDRLEYGVSRNFESLGNLTRRYSGVEYDAVVLLLGPARAPTKREWQTLAAFVEEGGALVFAPSSDEPTFDAEPFGVSGKELDKALDSGGEKNPIQVELGGLKGTFSWQSRGELLAPDDEQLVVADGMVQAVAQQHGLGTAVFVATDRPFDNRSLTWPDNAVLAFRLLEAAGYRSEAVFDESLNVSGTPKVVELLLDRPLRAFTLHVFVVLAVFSWWRSRRFGPLAPPSVGSRSDIVAHADAVGMLHYKTRDGRTVLRYYLHQLTRQLKLKKLTGVREDRVLDAVAKRLGRTTDDVRKAFHQAAAALKKDKLDRPTAAKHIRRLSKIRRAAARRS
ncbi:MAG: DUF4350 domain-containing protein [Planctomycetota bacterium]|nr:DUF4350 domain-containing protein [Planctomycetaceae bacterium]MDQ3331329.1 DUF4350 domain-containing protein [Planctomycetota bacterium]